MTKSAQILRDFLARLKAMPHAELVALIERATDKTRRQMTEDALRDVYHLGVSDGRANPWLPAACDKPDLVIAFSSDRDTLMLKAPGLVRSDELWVPAPPIAAPWSSR
jgi:hypothetical protein